MTGVFVTTLWLLDRGTALTSLPALWSAVLTGAFVRTGRPAFASAFSNRWHTRIAMFGLLVAGMHAVVGAVDAILLGAGLAPAPGYPTWFFIAGVLIGLLSLVAILVAVLSFLAPWRFDNPSLVHWLAYVGFVLGVVHAVAIGTDVVGLTRTLVASSLVVIALALVVKFTVGVGAGIKHFVTS